MTETVTDAKLFTIEVFSIEGYARFLSLYRGIEDIPSSPEK